MTPREALAVAAAWLHEAVRPRWTAALEMHEGQPARVGATLGSPPPPDALVEQAAALASPGPSQHVGPLGETLLSVGLWPHGAACGALMVGVDPQTPLPPAVRLLAQAQAEAETVWDLAEQAVTLRDRAPSAQELASLRERVLQRLWHELLTPVALIRAAHEQLSVLETDEKKRRPLRRIGTAVERLGHLFDLLNDILWAREAMPVRRKAAELAEGLVSMAGTQLLVEMASAGLADDALPLRAAATRLLDHARSLAPLIDEASAPVDLGALVRGVLERVGQGAEGRKLTFVVDAKGTEALPPRLVEDALSALLKNAFANTPDGSRIEVRAKRGADGLAIEVEDRGVGIGPERLRILLAGLNEARDPTWYSTGKPFAFGAGGAGLDLVRLQALGAWRGWRLEAQSTQCPYVDGEGRGCPGNAAACAHIAEADECARITKGTLVRIRVP